MTLFLTGSPTRYGEDHFTSDNGFLARLKAELPEKPSLLLVSAALADDLGDQVYIARLPERLDIDEFFRYLTE